MASVYLAELEGPGTFHKHVALKVIHPHLRRDPTFVRMFGDEALIAARLHHPNIVQTFDLVESNGHLAIAMEYAPGLPVSALRNGHLIDPGAELVAYIGAEAAAALDHAHNLTDALGHPLHIVHRDVSSSNVQIGLDGRVRLVDFGIARASDCAVMTTAGMIKGTLAYIAPERFTTGAATPQTDVWSLGVVLWEVLARRRLFRRPTDADTAAAVLMDEVPPLLQIRPEIPAKVSAVVHRAIERDPARRFASAAELESALRQHHPAKIEEVLEPLRAALAPFRQDQLGRVRRLLGRGEPEAGTVTASPSPGLAPAAEEPSWTPAPARWNGKRRFVALALVLVAVTAAWLLVRATRTDPERATAQGAPAADSSSDPGRRKSARERAPDSPLVESTATEPGADRPTAPPTDRAAPPPATSVSRRAGWPRPAGLTYDHDVYRRRSKNRSSRTAGPATPRP
ncbi:MAG: protein kinase [Deltaproteobacteria bacterium]|nr:protein kinase [Deltaproteobacteria bacterium]